MSPKARFLSNYHKDPSPSTTAAKNAAIVFVSDRHRNLGVRLSLCFPSEPSVLNISLIGFDISPPPFVPFDRPISHPFPLGLILGDAPYILASSETRSINSHWLLVNFGCWSSFTLPSVRRYPNNSAFAVSFIVPSL